MVVWTFPLSFPPGVPARTQGWRWGAVCPQAAGRRRAGLRTWSWDDPQGVWTGASHGLGPPQSPSLPIITVMFYRQSADGVSGKHFRLRFIKGSNKKSITL